jgi:hypothetical protein
MRLSFRGLKRAMEVIFYLWPPALGWIYTRSILYGIYSWDVLSKSSSLPALGPGQGLLSHSLSVGEIYESIGFRRSIPTDHSRQVFLPIEVLRNFPDLYLLIYRQRLYVLVNPLWRSIHLNPLLAKSCVAFSLSYPNSNLTVGYRNGV